MRYTKKIRQMGISGKDFEIMKYLYTEEQSKILPLASELTLPRTTVTFRLKELQKRNFTNKAKVMGHEEWQLTTQAKELLLNAAEKEEFHAGQYQTSENIIRIYKQILSDKSRERIYFIEPYNQTRSYVTGTDTKEIIDASRLFRKHQNISEGVSSERNIQLLREYETEVLKSMEGKMAIVYTVPDEYLEFEDALLVYKDTVYTINFDKQTVIEIKSSSFAQSIKSIILALRSYGKKIDLNQNIRNILRERGKL